MCHDSTPTALPVLVRNWLCAKYLDDPMPPTLDVGTDVPEPIVVVRFAEFAEFLVSIGTNIYANLDAWRNAGWIEDLMIEVLPPDATTDPPTECFQHAVARLGLTPGRYRLVGIRQAVVDAPTEAVEGDATEAADDSAVIAAKTLDSEKPKKLLFGWNQILDAIDLTDEKENRDRVSRLNKHFDGPIVQGGPRQSPMADVAILIPWWNRIDTLYGESVQRATDREATVSESYEHGREGEVVPDIAGHVQKRRGKR